MTIEKKKGRPFGHYDPEQVINQVCKERDEAQARFSVLWAFLKWVQSRDWTLNQLDERARELDYQGPHATILSLSAGDFVTDNRGRMGRVVKFYRDSVQIDWNGLPSLFDDTTLAACGVRRCS